MNMDSSNVSDMLLAIKEEPGTMDDNADNDDNAVPMMPVKDEPEAMNDHEQQFEDTFEYSGRAGEGLNSPFWFETDHVALKNNKDYHRLLRTIVLLQSQHMTCLKDFDTLLVMRKRALDEPIPFVEKLQSGVDLGIPRAQKVACLPTIPWDQYTADVDATLSMAAVGRGGSAPLTRNKIKTLLNIKEDPEPVSNSVTTSRMEDGTENGIKIRSSTFNQRWSYEEHMRFLKLIEKYPEERNQTKRHEKIARDLGTRSTVQVASHYQKYTKKLALWELPPPGSMRHGAYRRKRGGIGGRGRNRQSYSDLFGQTSTFLASYDVPVYMSENESDDNVNHGASYMGQYNGDYTGASEPHSESSDDDRSGDLDDDLIPHHLKSSAEYLELKQLKNIKRDFEDANSTAGRSMTDLKCVVCEEKLTGVSWKCMECPVGQVFCTACSKLEFNNGLHVSSHLLQKMDASLVGAQAVDQDYSYSGVDTYNYLDPNYRCKKPRPN